MTLKATIESLASTVAEKAKGTTTPFTETIDALKALTAFYAISLKDKGDPGDEPGDFTMDDARIMLERPANGSDPAAVRSRRGRSAAQ